MPRISGLHYRAFIDPSGGSADSITLAIAHEEDGRSVLDAVRETKPPFSPEAVVGKFAALLKSYGVSSATATDVRANGKGSSSGRRGLSTCWPTGPSRDMYRDLLPLLNSGKVELLDLPRLSMQLVGLERRTARSRRDSIEHAPGGQDDLANAVAGALLLASAPSGYDVTMNWVGGFDDWGLGGIMHGDFG